MSQAPVNYKAGYQKLYICKELLRFSDNTSKTSNKRLGACTVRKLSQHSRKWQKLTLVLTAE